MTGGRLSGRACSCCGRLLYRVFVGPSDRPRRYSVLICTHCDDSR